MQRRKVRTRDLRRMNGFAYVHFSPGVEEFRHQSSLSVGMRREGGAVDGSNKERKVLVR